MSAPLSNAQGFELVLLGKKWKLPVDLQKHIWTDVTSKYHRRHGSRRTTHGLSRIEKAHVDIQTAARRLLQIIKARWNGPRWIWHGFVGRRLDYARSVRLPKDMRRIGYDGSNPPWLRDGNHPEYNFSHYDNYMAKNARDPARYPVNHVMRQRMIDSQTNHRGGS